MPKCCSDGLIYKKRRHEFFPFGGSRTSQRHWNDPDNKLNRRRLRIDPLLEGRNKGEDPCEEPEIKKKPNIPI